MQYDAFSSYNRAERPDVLWALAYLEKAGLTLFRDQLNLLPGRDWRQEIEGAIAASRTALMFVGAHGFGQTQRWEIGRALAVASAQPSLSIIPVLLPGYNQERAPLGELDRFTWVDLSDRSELSLRELAAAIRGERPLSLVRAQEEARLERNPFRGLMSFREDDAPYFFGRETESQELAALVKEHRSVLLVGASGSGKSSIVNAGLLPVLRSAPDGAVWMVLTLRPEADPLASLARSIASVQREQSNAANIEIEAGRLRRHMAEDPVSSRGMFARLIAEHVVRTPQAGQIAPTHVLVIVDQLEELFTLVDDEAVRLRFVEELAAAASATTLPIHVLAGFRADYYHRLTQVPLLNQLFRKGQLNVGAMEPAALRRVVEQPAAKAGLRFEEGLIRTILDDMRGGGDALPLLEFLLDQLWQAARPDRSRILTREHYERVGGVQGAIARYADEVYLSLPEADQDQLHTLLVSRLVRVGDEELDSRKPLVGLAALPVAERRLIELLATKRLLTVSDDRAELVHEALLRKWDRFKRWIDTERQDLQFRDRLEEDAKSWTANKESSQFLLAEGTARAAEDLRQRKPYLLAGDTSVAKLVARSTREIDQRQQRERGSQRKIGILLGTVLGVVALALAGLGAYTYWLSTAQTQLSESKQELKDRNQQLTASNSGLKQAVQDAQKARLNTQKLLADTVDNSNQIVNKVATTLGRTGGVPPVAVTRVIDAVQKTIEETGKTLKNEPDLEADKSETSVLSYQWLTEADAELLRVETNLAAGTADFVKPALDVAKDSLDKACSSDRPTDQCGLRLGRRKLLAIIADSFLAPQERSGQAAAAMSLANSMEKSGPVAGSELWLLVMRTRIHAGRRFLEASIGSTADEKANQLKSALDAVEPCTRKLPEQSAKVAVTGDPDHDTATLRLRCLQIQLEAEAANSAKPEAIAATLKAIASEPLMAGPDQVAAALADGAYDLDQEAAIALAEISSGHIQALQDPTQKVKALELMTKGLTRLEKLVAENESNLALKTLYLSETANVMQTVAHETDAGRTFLLDMSYAKILERRSTYLIWRLRKLPKDGSSPEYQQQRQDLANTLAGLYFIWFAKLKLNRELIDHYESTGATKDARSVRDILNVQDGDGDAYVNVALTDLYWVAKAYRDAKLELPAVETMRLVNRTANRQLGDRRTDKTGTDSSPTQSDRLYRYFAGNSISFLSKIDVAELSQEPKAKQVNIGKLLEDLVVTIKAAFDTEPGNIEFETAYAAVLAANGTWLANTSDTNGAKSQYAAAAQHGSATAISWLRQLSTPRINLEAAASGSKDQPKPVSIGQDRAAAQQALEYERRRREIQPLEVAVEGQSSFLGGKQFTAYLAPASTGGDPIKSEIDRLKNYYGLVALTPDSEARLHDIYDKAREKAAKDNSPVTAKYLKKALDDIDKERLRLSPFGNLAFSDKLKEADTAIKDGSDAHAMSTLDGIKSGLPTSIDVRDPDNIHGWATLALAYLDLAGSQINKSPDSAATAARVGADIVTRINSAVDTLVTGQKRKTSGAGDGTAMLADEPSRAAQFRVLADDLRQTAAQIRDIFDRRIKSSDAVYEGDTGIYYSDHYYRLMAEIVDRSSKLLAALPDPSSLDIETLVGGEVERAGYLAESAQRRLTTGKGFDETRGNQDARNAIRAIADAQATLRQQIAARQWSLNMAILDVRSLQQLAILHNILKEPDSATRVWHEATAASVKMLNAFPTDSTARLLAAETYEGFARHTDKLTDDSLESVRRYLGSVPEGPEKDKALFSIMKTIGASFDRSRERGTVLDSGSCAHVRAMTNAELSSKAVDTEPAKDPKGGSSKSKKDTQNTLASASAPETKLDVEGDLYWRAQELLRCAIELRVTVLQIDPDAGCACEAANAIEDVISILGKRTAEFKVDPELKEISNFADVWLNNWTDIERLYDEQPKDLANLLAISKAGLERALARSEILYGAEDSPARYTNALKHLVAAEEHLHDRHSIDPKTDREYSTILSDMTFSYLMTRQGDKASQSINRARSFYKNTDNVDLNYAHVLLLVDGDFEGAMAKYKDKSKGFMLGENRLRWLDEAMGDLDQLAAIYGSDDAAGSRIRDARQQLQLIAQQRNADSN